jgi:hypothetical protein
VSRLITISLTLSAACSAPGVATSASSSAILSDEDRWYATQAALLDPRCYQLAATNSAALDVTVPDGHSWWVTNAFAVTYGDPQFVAQDAFPNTRRSGFLRPLDARRAFALSAGTRVRNNMGISVAYIWYCDPDLVWSTDPRYTDRAAGAVLRQTRTPTQPADQRDGTRGHRRRRPYR